MIFPSGTAFINPFWQEPDGLGDNGKLLLKAHAYFVVRYGKQAYLSHNECLELAVQAGLTEPQLGEVVDHGLMELKKAGLLEFVRSQGWKPTEKLWQRYVLSE